MTQPKTSLQDPDDFVLVWDDATEFAPVITTDEEARAILSSPQGEGFSDQETSDILNSLVAAGDMHTGAMIALRPSSGDLTHLAAYADEPMDELHCTLLYLGDAALISADEQESIIATAAQFVELKELKARGFSVAIFNPDGDESCVVLQVGDSQQLLSLRDTLFKSITQIMGDRLPKQHVPYIPHITLSYDADASHIPQLTHLVGPITFDAIRIAFGSEIIDIEFEGEDEDD